MRASSAHWSACASFESPPAPPRSRSVRSSDKGIVIAAVEVKAHVGQLVQETEPEVVDAVVPEREADDWPAVPEPERCAVQMCPGQVINDFQRDAVLGEENL